MPSRIYETVVGYFVQDRPEPAQVSFWRELPARFGLIDDSPDRWTRFKASIQQLNVDTLDPVQYKVFFLGRHGEGYHNVALPKHGRQAWDDYWSKLNGDGVLTWGPDPVLTPRGEGQVDEVHAEWQKEHRFGIPLPDKLYCSPLTRAIQTNERTFSGLLPGDRKTVIVENIRELLGIHTCDKRRTRSYIQETFPEYVIEEGFAEEDQLWNPDIRETCNDIDVRAKEVLDMIFECDTEHFISITAHGGFIKAFLRVTGHLEWSLPPGGVIPVVIKASRES